MIKMSPKAKEELQKILNQNKDKGFRIVVKGFG